MKTITIGMAVLCSLLIRPCIAESLATSAFPGIQDTICDLTLELTVTNDCVAGGSITSSLTGGTAPFVYLWSNGSSEADLSGLLSGDYTLIVADVNGCGDTVTATIDLSNSLVMDPVASQTYCGLENGSIFSNVTGGVEPYTYEWSTGATTVNIGSLAAGIYELTVTEATGCYIAMTFDISSSSPIGIVQYVVQETCGMSNGSASISVNNGVAPFTYEWSNGATDAEITAIAADTFYVTVTDTIGCVATAVVIVPGSTAPFTNVNVVDGECGGSGGSVILLTSGGVPPYTYLWNTGDSVDQLDSLAAGTYTVTVTDSVGCSTIETAEVESNGGNPPVISYTVNNPGCGQTDGSINVSVNGGVAPYSFEWNTSASTEDIDNITAGTYTLTVTGANGCSAFESIELTDSVSTCNAPTQLNVTLNGTSATFTWTDNPCAVKYRLRVKKNGPMGGPWQLYIIEAPTTTYTINDLVPGAEYKFRMRSQCSDNGSMLSAQTPLQYFVVSAGVASCSAPSGITSADVTASGATINWNFVAGSYGYRLRYRELGTQGWTPVVINNGNAATFTITGLQVSTTYEYQIATKCEIGPNIFSVFSITATFTTLPQRLGENEKLTIELYPNPTSGEVVLKVDGSNEIVDLVAYDSKGQAVYHQYNVKLNDLVRFDVAGLAAGFYTVELRGATSHYLGRLIKE